MPHNPPSQHNGHHLLLVPPPEHKMRWLAKDGEPVCVLEFISQLVARIATYVPFYIALVVTLTLIIQIFGKEWW